MCELGNAVRHTTFGVNTGFDQTGSDGIDPNTFGGQFVCQAKGEGLNCSFAGRLVYILMRHALAGSS